MIATSVLLSACVLAHTDEETSASLIDRLINKDAPTVDAVDESTEQRRLTPPEMGVEGGPCRTGWMYSMFGQRCDWGLYCQQATDGSANYGYCRQYGWSPNGPFTGNANQPCNQSGPRCNHSNLRPRWEHGEFCTCEYFLGEASPESSTQDQATTTSTADDSTRLGMRAPTMGGEGEPCRNTRGDECNYGLQCHYSTRDGSSIQGRCRRRNPAPAPTPRPDHHNTGYAGERCNPAPYSPCNTDNLKPEYHQMYPSGTSCVCQTVDPEPRVGEAGGRCNRAPYSPCNSSNLAPRYHQLLPSGYSCTCEYNLQ